MKHKHIITVWTITVTSAILLASCIVLPLPKNQNYSAEDTMVISIDKPGIYRLSLKDIEWNNVPQKEVQLSHKGTIMPIHWVDNDTIEFFAPPEENKYTNFSYFILQKNAESPLINQLQSTHPMEWADFINVTISLNDNNIYLPTVEHGDHWLMERIIAPGSADYEFHISNLYNNAMSKLSISLWSSTETPQENDHTVQIYINNQYLDQYSWDGITWISNTIDLPTNLLRNGKNQISIKTENPSENISIIYIDSIILKVPVKISHYNDQIIYETQKNVRFSDIVTTYLFDNNHPYSNLFYVQDTYIPYKPGYTNVSTFDNIFYNVSDIRPYNKTTDLKSAQNAYDYLVIADQSLHEALAPLMAMRNSQGLTPLLIDPQPIFDQFGYGYPEPDAISAFLDYALGQWKTPPKYVLLIGDYTYDPKGYQHPIPQYILPSHFIQTVYGGESLSDVLFVVSQNKDTPQIAIGRIPVSTSNEVETVVNKIIAYETNSQNAKYIYTTSDPSDKQFYIGSQQFMATLNNKAKYIDPDSIKTDGLKSLSYDGLTLIYFGHGSIDTWGKDEILSANFDFSTSSPLPLIINMTCLTGYFYHPEITSLAESLLLAPHGGAVAVIAPSSLTLPTDQSYISNAIARTLSSGSTIRIGDMILDAWQNSPDSTSSSQDALLTFMLFGDPAMKLVIDNN